MKAAVRPQGGRFRVVDEDDPEQAPIHNREDVPIDGGGHRHQGTAQLLADEVNEVVQRRSRVAEE